MVEEREGWHTRLKSNYMLSNAIGVEYKGVCTPKIRSYNATLVLANFVKYLKSRKIAQRLTPKYLTPCF